jgi:UDP-N-acetylmuramoylalanine--D-glutamate ligase
MGALVIDGFTRSSPWREVHAVVAGLGVAGFACADALMQLGARVTVVEEQPATSDRADILRTLGVDVRDAYQGPIPAADVLVVSPGLLPNHPFIIDAQARAIPVWGELELAWRLRPEADPAPWLTVTGTNGKTTTTMMLAAMLSASGARTIAAGNIGLPLVDIVMHDSCDVIAVEVGAPQLPFVTSMSPLAAVCLNLAEDHIDHFGSMPNYRVAKARIYRHTQRSAVYNVEDAETERMVEQADVVEGCRAIGFTTGIPAISMLGVVDDVLVDRAFIPQRADAAVELADVRDVRPGGMHNVANALAAAALARSFGVEPRHVAQGLRDFMPAPHRNALVAEHAGVRYIDDSKATNTHAAQTAMRGYESIIWIAGGMAKGQEFDDLVSQEVRRLRGVILIGVDQDRIAQALERHAPDIPLIRLNSGETADMDAAVQAAADMARHGDTVLLAPGCASWDMFDNYGHRGECFAAAVRNVVERT